MAEWCMEKQLNMDLDDVGWAKAQLNRPQVGVFDRKSNKNKIIQINKGWEFVSNLKSNM